MKSRKPNDAVKLVRGGIAQHEDNMHRGEKKTKLKLGDKQKTR